MPFCSQCGAEYQAGSKFCGSCGMKVAELTAQVAAPPAVEEEKVLWEGKPAALTDRLKDKMHLNSVSYILTSQRLRIKWGLIGKKEDEIELVRINDIRATQGVKDRLLGVGKVVVTTTDTLNPSFTLEDIRDPHKVKEIIRSAVREEKQKQRVNYHERL